MSRPEPTDSALEITSELLKKYDRAGPRYTSYPTAAQFADLSPEHYDKCLAAAGESEETLSVYFHLPFCEERCHFCACNVIISPDKRRVSDYLDDVMVEMELVAERTPHRRTYSQLHLGGGTPTYFAPDQLDRLLETFRGHFRPADISESSVEVDPRVTTHAHLEVFAKWGFERLSVGVQDFNADVQRAVNRVQSYAITDEIIQAGRKLGMESINVDVIYGLPGQTPEGFAETLKQVIDLGADRLAVYGFAYLPTLKGNQRSMTSDMLPSRDVRFELQAVGRRTLCDAGYVDIGMDHFALPKDPLTTAQQAGRLHRNFMGYTTDTADTMLGFGISSIGFVDGSYIQNERKLSRYRESIRAGRLPIERGLVTTVDDRIRARVIQEMMCNFVIHPSQIADRFGIDFEAYFETELDEMRELAEVGMIRIGEDRIEATTLGRSFVRNLALPFDAYLRSGDTSLYSQTV